VLKAVLDTNILVSGIILDKGLPHQIVKAWEQGRFLLVSSRDLIDELKRVLEYPKIKRKYGLTPTQIRRVVLNIYRYGVYVEEPPTINIVLADPSDNRILAAAIGGGAEVIVSGDEDLLSIRSFRGVEILTAREFVSEKLR
jgi:putative PIN family toxin of toxin-antitoxin system